VALRAVLTYADLAALPPDGKRYELHEGEISVSAAPRPRHQLVVGNLHLLLAAHVRARALGEIFLAPVDVILSDVTVLEPDLVYVDAGRLGLVTERGIEGPPTLAIEVLSPATAAVDRGVKRRLLARYGIPHHWIVDADARVIESFQLARPGPPGEADASTYAPGPRLDGPGPAALPPFPDLALDPAAVWR
jgi:Uma2 family endonuclease